MQLKLEQAFGRIFLSFICFLIPPRTQNVNNNIDSRVGKKQEKKRTLNQLISF